MCLHLTHTLSLFLAALPVVLYFRAAKSRLLFPLHPSLLPSCLLPHSFAGQIPPRIRNNRPALRERKQNFLLPPPSPSNIPQVLRRRKPKSLLLVSAKPHLRGSLRCFVCITRKRRRRRRPPSERTAMHAERLAIRHPVPVAEPDPATIVNIVYVTASATFTGPIGGYTTQTIAGIPLQQTRYTLPETATLDDDVPTTSRAIYATKAPPSRSISSALERIRSSTAQIQSEPTSALTEEETYSPYRSSTGDGFGLASHTPGALSTSAGPVVSSGAAAISPTSSASLAQESASKSVPGGMSAGEKTGLAIGILGIIGLLAGLLLFCYRRRRRVTHRRIDDEKTYVSAPPPYRQSSSTNLRTVGSGSTAPRLSLRPVTAFYPDLVKPGTGTNSLTLAPTNMSSQMTPAVQVTPSSVSAWERKVAEKRANELANPFSNRAAINSQPSLTGLYQESNHNPSGVIPLAAASFDGAGKVSTKRPVSPADTEISELPTSANSPPRTAGRIAPAAGTFHHEGMTNNIHRVQLDFKPSMDDELDLCAGQLVRMLHEYDDGWVSSTALR